jgi:uncharacterized protein YvpB
MLKAYGKSAIISLVVIFTVLGFTQAKPKIESYVVRNQIEDLNQKTLREVKEARVEEETEAIVEELLQTTDPIYASDLEKEQISILPKKYLEVPFVCQAPLQTEENWKLHEESCEEAALLQAYLYETGKFISKEQANEVILDMIEWQEKTENFGTHKDLYSKGMTKFITGYYNLEESSVKVIKNADIEDIKGQITKGHPVIVPITGEILKNPYYPYPGYHMLTVIGYTEDRIITNDNGTRNGADFSYNQKTFEAAMKDASGDIIILDLSGKD